MWATPPGSCPPGPLPPTFPSVSKTSFHRPWSWTPFLLSIAAASGASPRQSHPRPNPAETAAVPKVPQGLPLPVMHLPPEARQGRPVPPELTEGTTAWCLQGVC